MAIVTHGTRHARLTAFLSLGRLRYGAFLVLSGCGPSVYIGATIGTLNPMLVQRLDLSSVYSCPGEKVEVGWMCPDCDSLTVQENGNPPVLNPNPKGPSKIGITPMADTKFVAVGKNKDGETVATVDIHVLRNGQSVLAGAAKREEPVAHFPYWQSDLPAWSYSNVATVYQARFAYGVPNVPVGSSWFLIDPKNNTSVMLATFTPVADAPLVGAWRDHNAGILGASGLPDSIANELTVRCP
jgi:hypothetical protein